MSAAKMSSAIYTKVPVSVLSFDTTNPREVNQKVVDTVLLSLKRFGLVMPIIAFKDGIILGGHQRIKALKSDGQQYVYVNYIKSGFKRERMTINMALNRVIQEIDQSQKDVVFISDEERQQIENLDTVEDYALQMKNVKFGDVNLESLEPNRNLISLEKYLYSRGVRLPVLVDSDLNVLMGKQRALFYKMNGKKTPYIIIDEKRKNLIAKALRGVSNSFDFNDKDYLRTSARRHIVNNMVQTEQVIYGKYKPQYNFSIYVESIKRKLGNNILDFGAGNGKQTAYMRQLGVKITTFEPFVPTGGIVNEVSLLKTKQNYERFLEELKKHEPFTTVIANAVLNSVPLKDDIYKVCYLLRCFAIGGTLQGTTRSWIKKDDEKGGFLIGDRRRMSIGAGKLKVQNFISKEQLVEYMTLKPDLMKLKGQYLHYIVHEDCMEVSISHLNECIDVEFGFVYGDRRFDFRDETKKVMLERLQDFEKRGLCKLYE